MLEVSSTVSRGFPGDGWEFIISLFGEEWSQQKQNKIIVPQKPKRWNSSLLLSFQESVIVQFCFYGCCEKTIYYSHLQLHQDHQSASKNVCFQQVTKILFYYIQRWMYGAVWN